MKPLHRFAAMFVAWMLLTAAALAANVRWTGNAQDVAQVTTITASGTWATADTATITCNKKSVTVTLGTAVTVDDVVAAIAAAINAGSATTDLVGDETRNVGGQSIPEFTEIVASSSGAVLTLRSSIPGVPFTVTRSESTAGDGALGAVTAVTAATGKHWLNNADNYEGGALPVDNDVLYFDTGNVSVYFGLDYFRSGTIDLDVIISNDWLGQFGLPLQNPRGYVEYRPRWFQYKGESLKSIQFVRGVLGQAGQGRCWIDLQDQSGPRVDSYAKRGSGDAPTVFLAGSATSTALGRINVEAGAVAIEPDEAPTAPSKYMIPGAIIVGVPSGDASDAIVVVGRNARIYKAAAPMRVFSGQVTLYANTKLSSDEMLTQVYGGSVETRGVGTDHIYDVYAGGSIFPNGPTSIAEVNLFGGTLDCRRAAVQTNLAVLTAYAGSAILDPAGQIADLIDCVGCSLSQLTLDLPSNRQFDLSATATP